MLPLSVPGVIVNHTPAVRRQFNGCPSLAILQNGDYIASHSLFGSAATNTDSFVYRSRDKGQTWQQISTVSGQIWSKLFVHRNSLYLVGTDHCDNYDGRLNGRIVIRRSVDGGNSWTNAQNAMNGQLTAKDGFHTSAVPVVEHHGRLWKAMEFAPSPNRNDWQAFVISIPSDADLLKRDNWTFTNMLSHPWSKNQWIEGNVVVSPSGQLFNILRQDQEPDRLNYLQREKAVITRISPDGLSLSHSTNCDQIDFPGANTKFTINYDPVSDCYLSLVNPQDTPNRYRNRLALSASRDLQRWAIVHEVLYHPDSETHAFQYVDWLIEDDDIIFLSRTAYDDGLGGAIRAHDANYTTFHRIPSFRQFILPRI